MTQTLQSKFRDESELRARAVAAARHACNGDIGRGLGDPVFEQVTEGRNRSNRKYSACGDLAHHTLREVGVTDERLINRNDDGGHVPWKMTVNISRIVFSSGPAFVWTKARLRPKPGDIIYVASPDHVAVLEYLDETKGTVATFDYGQWDAKRGLPAGKRRISRFRVAGSKLYVGSRELKGWLDISRLPGLLPANVHGLRPRESLGDNGDMHGK